MTNGQGRLTKRMELWFSRYIYIYIYMSIYDDIWLYNIYIYILIIYNIIYIYIYIYLCHDKHQQCLCITIQWLLPKLPSMLVPVRLRGQKDEAGGDIPFWIIWWLRQVKIPYGYGSIPINSIFRGMNIHKSQLFWCELQGYYWFWHTAIWPHIFHDVHDQNMSEIC